MTTMAHLAASLRARQLAAGIRVVDCLVKRTKPYVAAGRWEDEAAARRIDGFATELLQVIAPQYHVVHDAVDVLRTVAGWEP